MSEARLAQLMTARRQRSECVSSDAHATQAHTRLTNDPLITMESTPVSGRRSEMYVSVGYQPGPTPSTQLSLRASDTARMPLLASAKTGLRNVDTERSPGAAPSKRRTRGSTPRGCATSDA